ncbi:MAG: hypothetical protein GXZ05_05520 [Gammaproteobacteria bacterium]|nr:hypothetical protein [Gammaproteobacteria bacterium]
MSNDPIKTLENKTQEMAKKAKYRFVFNDGASVELYHRDVVATRKRRLEQLKATGDWEGALLVAEKNMPESTDKIASLFFKELAATPIRQGVRAARQRSKAGFSSGEQRQAERAPAWQLWQQAIDEVIAAYPDNKNKKFACDTAAKRYPELAETGLSADGARRNKHINWPESYSRRKLARNARMPN